jgi:hypothetical protein
MNRCAFKFSLFLVSIAFLSVPVSSRAANIEAQNYKRAFALVESGHADQAVIFAIKGRDPVLNKALRAYYMQQPGNNASFGEITGFIAKNPQWPGQRALRMAAEQKIPADATSGQIIRWFGDNRLLPIAGSMAILPAKNSTPISRVFPVRSISTRIRRDLITCCGRAMPPRPSACIRMLTIWTKGCPKRDLR